MMMDRRASRARPAGVSDHVGVALIEPECGQGENPGVHAGQHDEAQGGRRRQVGTVEVPGIGLVGPQQIVDRAHADVSRFKAVRTLGIAGAEVKRRKLRDPLAPPAAAG